MQLCAARRSELEASGAERQGCLLPWLGMDAQAGKVGLRMAVGARGREAGLAVAAPDDREW